MTHRPLSAIAQLVGKSTAARRAFLGLLLRRISSRIDHDRRMRGELTPPPPRPPRPLPPGTPPAPHHWAKSGTVIDQGVLAFLMVRDPEGDARWTLYADPAGKAYVIGSGKARTTAMAQGQLMTAIAEHLTTRHKR